MLKLKKMDSLVKIDLTNSNDVKIKRELASNFVNNFTNVELSVTENNRIKRNVVPSTDLLNIAGYFVTRRDIIAILAELSEDLPINETLNLKKVLSEMLANPNHAVNKQSAKKMGLGIELGYGSSRQRTEGGRIIPSTKEVQLVVSSITDFVENKSNGIVKSSYTTAKIRSGAEAITPPTGGTKYPNTLSDTE